MFRRRYKSRVGLFLLMLMSIGLTISTLHSHHHLEWHKSSDVADTEHCISKDTTLCPISGYIFETEILSPSQSGDIFFQVKEVIKGKDIHLIDFTIVLNRGRSPPALI